jgi:hypothetical protein
MTTDDPILQELADANTVAVTSAHGSAEAERVLRRVLADAHADARPPAPEEGPRRRPFAIALGALSVLVVAAVVVIAATVVHHGSNGSTPPAGGRIVTLVYRVQPTPRAPRVTSAAINREIAVIRARLAGEPVQAMVKRLGGDEIRLGLSGSHLTDAQLSAVEQRATATGSLGVYDWESDVLLGDGKTVASQLPSQNPHAVQISQGDSATLPGAAGGMTLYRAVTLAAKQPTAAGGSRLGSAYYLFGAPGSNACATAAADQHTRPVAGAHCYLAGPVPDQSTPSTLPTGVKPSDGTWVKVPQGTLVLGALDKSGLASRSGPTRFFVVRDRAALANVDVTHVRAIVQSGEHELQLTLSEQGGRAFQDLTSTIAHRGQILSEGSEHLFQHLAVGLDSTLITVPQVDFTQYPDGVVLAKPVINILAGDASQTGQLAAILRAGPLPLSLIQIGRGEPGSPATDPVGD